MARVTYGESITEYAGSIGGVTYHKNASGNIARLRPNPTVNPTPLQAGYQTNMAKCVAFWPTLSQANKDTWDAFAAAHDHITPWGETKTLSGYQWFLSVNLMRLLIGYSICPDAPGWYAAPPPDQFTIETSSTYIRCAWSPNYDAPYSLLAYCTLPLRQSSLKLRRSLFYLTLYPSAPSLANWDLTTLIESLFNVTWSTFYASADCSIIIRLRHGVRANGLWSFFTSAIVKID